MRLRTPRERGAALLTAMVSVAVLTAVATDLAYQSRIALQIAANGRDELRASWRARGVVQLSRLVLTFQQQLDDASGAGGPLASAAGGVPQIQLTQFVPIGALAEGLFAGGPGAGGAAGGAPSAADATIEDEARKVNAQLRGLGTERTLWQNVQALYQLVCDARWDPLFEREDRNGVRTSRQDLLVRIRDWVNEGDQSAGLVVSGSGAPCGMVIGQPPFEVAFGDKHQPYDRGEQRYRAKNARMDSLDELYLVAGVGDAFMAAFGDALTVYLPQDAKRNVNEPDRARQVELARVIADPPLQPGLLDPRFPERLGRAISERTLGGVFRLTPQQFGAAVQAAGVQINAGLLVGDKSPFTDRSSTYRIRATGSAGPVTTKVEAVVRLVPPQGQAALATPVGLALPTVVHWRED